jgi:type IV pilus assembly protein PilA
MLQRLRNRAGGQEGFTLIELLVVILIIGILAAVAIPAFLNQKGKAQDANVKTDITTAQTAEESYNTSNATGGYVSASTGTNALTTIEPTLAPAMGSATEALTVTAPGTALYGGTDPTGGSAALSYVVQAKSPSNVLYALNKYADGGVSRTCNVATTSINPAGCNLGSATSGNGTW